MKKIFILFIMVLVSVACGSKSVEVGNPNFPDNESVSDTDIYTDADTENDSDTDEIFTDNDTIIDPDDDSAIDPDNDSVVDPDDDIVADPDNDSVVIPDDDAVTECIIGEQKCDDAKDNVLECNVDHEWVSVADCSAPLKMCVESPADNFFCDDLVCEPGVKFCKNEDVYTCNADGKSDVLSQNCTNTQYCNNAVDPVICSDIICDPSDIYCESDELRECSANGSSFTTLKNCADGSGVCNGVLKDCVYTGEVGGTSKFDRTGQRGNFFSCTKDVKVVEFAQELEFSGNKDLSWAVYEAEGGSTTYSRVFTKSTATAGTGKAYYSTGTISLNLVSGKKYIFTTGWSGTITAYYGYNVSEIGFGTAENAHSLDSSSMAQTLTNPSRYNIIFNQRIQFTTD